MGRVWDLEVLVVLDVVLSLPASEYEVILVLALLDLLLRLRPVAHRSQENEGLAVWRLLATELGQLTLIAVQLENFALPPLLFLFAVLLTLELTQSEDGFVAGANCLEPVPPIFQQLNLSFEVIRQVIENLLLSECVAVDIALGLVIFGFYLLDILPQYLVGLWLRRKVLFRRRERVVHVQVVKGLMPDLAQHSSAAVAKVARVQYLSKRPRDVDHACARTMVRIDQAYAHFRVLRSVRHQLWRHSADLPIATA